MKKLFLALAAVGLALGSAYAEYVILGNELEPYAKSDEVVSSVRDLTGDVALEEGANISITATDNTISIAAADAPAQVQSDWSETNSASPAYIANKPSHLSDFVNDEGYVASNAVAEIARYIVNEMAVDGWVIDGTKYQLVVLVTPPPVETVFTLDGGTEETNSIVGTLDRQWMVDAGYCSFRPFSEWQKTVIEADIGSGVTSVGDEVFAGCASLTDVAIPGSATNIGVSAFSGCSGLTSVVIPGSVTSIGASAFSDCGNLADVTIGAGVTSIASFAFNNCTSLTSVVVPDGVTSIGTSAFEGCSGLTSVTIPHSSATNLGSHAFYLCPNLMSVDMSGTSVVDFQRGLPYYPWGLPHGCVITCSDGTVTIL